MKIPKYFKVAVCFFMNSFKVTLLLVLKEIVNKNKIIAFTIIKY